MKGKGSAASIVESAVDSNRTTRHLDAIAVGDWGVVTIVGIEGLDGFQA
jgi:hypothetical protein